LKDYRVDLDVYNGPLDLLLFLIRREEVDIYDIPIARITEQYVQYVQMIERLDPNIAGDFLVLAATLLEIKSRSLLPRPPVVEEDEDDLTDPRLELVRQLLEYKKFKDAARGLGLAVAVQALKHPRTPRTPDAAPDEVELDDLQLWDLFDAFSRLIEQTGRRQRTHEVVYDDTPLALHATDIVDSLERAGGSQAFEAVFEGRSRSQFIGLFLALLELIRRRRVRVQQDRTFGTIYVHLLDASPIETDFNRAFEPVAEPDAEFDEPEPEPSADLTDEEPADMAGGPFDADDGNELPAIDVQALDTLDLSSSALSRRTSGQDSELSP